jgi:actin-like ATPase involved in cell morphogenesis
MTWTLGVDLGTTFTAAAVVRDGQARMVNLGQRSAAIPSVVFLREDDEILTGEVAARRGVSEPDRVAREFKRRVGDPAPMLLGGVPMSADALLARLLAWTVGVVSEREGGPPDHIAVCHPANWGPYKLELLAQACQRAGLSDITLISEPEAAAVCYASQARVELGAVVAVYDLGGGTFDAAALRKTENGFALLGRPEGIERLGGIDFDEAVLGHVLRHVGDSVAQLDDNPASLVALARLRQECVDAKEALSADSETSVPVMLPGLNTEVRLTRAEFESMIRVPVLETVAALRRALQSAHIDAQDLEAVLLVGGSSRIPMVAQMVSAELGRPVAVDADPKHVTALGAALAAGAADARVPVAVGTAAAAVASAPGSAPASAPPVPPVPPAVEPPVAVPATPDASDASPSGPVPPSTPASQPTSPRPKRGGALVVGAIAAVVVLLAAIVAVVALSGGGAEASGWVSACPAAPSVCITEVENGSNGVTAQFVTNDVQLVADATGDEFQAIFFLTTIEESEAGSVANRTTAWAGWGPRSPFRGFTSGTSDANAVCVLVGNAAGQVAENSGNCAQLPSKEE